MIWLRAIFSFFKTYPIYIAIIAILSFTGTFYYKYSRLQHEVVKLKKERDAASQSIKILAKDNLTFAGILKDEKNRNIKTMKMVVDLIKKNNKTNTSAEKAKNEIRELSSKLKVASDELQKCLNTRTPVDINRLFLDYEKTRNHEGSD